MLANDLRLKNKTESIKILRDVKIQAKKSDSLYGLYCRIYANLKSNELQVDSALFYLNNSRAAFERSGNKRQIALTLLNTGNIFLSRSEFDKALSIYFQALKITEQNGYVYESAMIYKNIGVVFISQNKSEQALKYSNLSLDLFSKLKDTNAISSVYINIGNTYYNQFDDQNALKYYNKALTLETLKKDSINIAKLYQNIGAIYVEGIQDTTLGLTYLLKALEIKEKNGESNDLIFQYTNLAQLYLNLSDYKRTEYFLLKGSAMAQKSNNRKELIEIYKIRAAMLFAKKEYKEAYLIQQLYSDIKDSVLNIEKLKIPDEIEAKFEVNKKDLEIANSKLKLNEQQNKATRQMYIIIVVSTIAVFSIILLYFYFRNKRIKFKKESEEKSVLLMLESEQKERIRIARELHDSIGQKLTVLKMFASGSDHLHGKYQSMLDETIAEVRSLSHNLIPEILNLGLETALQDLVAKINVAGEITAVLNGVEELAHVQLSKQSELSLYRILQEILNNMLKHSGANRIEINFERTGTLTTCTIKDNGTGFDVAGIYNSKGIGWNNIFARSKLIPLKVSISSSKEGTAVTLTFI